MFENNGHIHVYSPGVGADNPIESKAFQNYKSSVKDVKCDQDDFTKFMFRFPRRLHKKLALIGQVMKEKRMFENNVHKHVYSPGAGADNPLG